MRSSAPAERLNILMIAAQQTGGGAGRCGEQLAESLRAQGHGVTSFVRDNPNGDPHSRQALYWRTRPLAKWLNSAGFPEIGHVESLLWRCHADYAAADVLHLHNIHGEYLSLLGLPLWGFEKPIVWTLHDFWALSGNCATPRGCTRWQNACGRCPRQGVYPMTSVDRSALYRRIKPLLIRAAGPRLVTPSRWLAERVRAHPVLRRLAVRIIRSPIDTDLFTPTMQRAALREEFGLQRDRPTIVMSGGSWLDPFKGGADAVYALRLARERNSRLQLLVVGAGSRQLLAASGMTGQALEFLSDRAALARVYAAGDLCLFPSRAENYPLTVLESLASGTPVVAYDVGGVPEQIEHLRTGYVARDGDFAALSAGIIEFARTSTRSAAAGAWGRTFVLRTSHVEIARREYEHEYHRARTAWAVRHGRKSAQIKRGWLSRFLARRLNWDAAAATGAIPSTPRDSRVPAAAIAGGGA